MTRNTTIVTVSIPIQYSDFLAERDLSPSALLQSKIQEEMERWTKANIEISKLQGNIERMSQELQRMISFIETKNQMQEWLAFRRETHGTN